MIGRLLCRMGLHKWFTVRVGGGTSEWGEPAAWGLTSCVRPDCGQHFQWVGKD